MSAYADTYYQDFLICIETNTSFTSAQNSAISALRFQYSEEDGGATVSAVSMFNSSEPYTLSYYDDDPMGTFINTSSYNIILTLAYNISGEGWTNFFNFEVPAGTTDAPGTCDLRFEMFSDYEDYRGMDTPIIIFISTNYPPEGNRTIEFLIYDKDYSFIDSRTITVSPLTEFVDVPQYGSYDMYPQEVYIDTSLSVSKVQTFTCYAMDFYVTQQAAYDKGYKEASEYYKDLYSSDQSSSLNAKYKEGYDQGFKDGYADGSDLTGAERDKLKSDYNAITGFFDGLFNSLFGFTDYIFSGIGIGGLSLGTVVWTFVILAVVVIVGGKIL